jgi:hypothetical protein
MIYTSPPTVALQWPSAFTVNVLFPKQMPALKVSLRRVPQAGAEHKGRLHDGMTFTTARRRREAFDDSRGDSLSFPHFKH